MRTVFEEAIRTGETTFPHIWGIIQTMAAAGMNHEAIAAALRARLPKRTPSENFWQWVDDAITAALHRSAIEATQRRRQFRLVKGENR